MSLIYDPDFQIGAILMVIALLITIFSKNHKYPKYVASLLQGMGLGFVCIPMFDGSKIHIVIIFLLWMILTKPEKCIQKSSMEDLELSSLLEKALDNEKEIVRLTCHNVLGQVLAGEKLQNTVIFHLENFVKNISDLAKKEGET